MQVIMDTAITMNELHSDYENDELHSNGNNELHSDHDVDSFAGDALEK